MHRFFQKYAKNLGEDLALEMLHQKLYEAKSNLKEGKEYCLTLAEISDMIEDIFESKEIDPNKYYEENDQNSEDYQNQSQSPQYNQQYYNRQQYPKYRRGSSGIGGRR